MRVAKDANGQAGGHAADDDEMAPVELSQTLALMSAEFDALAVLAFEITDGSNDRYARTRADAILKHLVMARTWQTFVFADWRELTRRTEKMAKKSASRRTKRKECPK